MRYNKFVHTAHHFPPPRQLGILFHLALILLLLGAGLLGFYQASLAETGEGFLFFLLPSLLLIGLVPILVYRVYALWNASYSMERDGMRLRWGLRYEEVPMDKIVWVRPASQLAEPLSLPALRWPGSIVGVRRYPDGTILEFMASQANGLILVATSNHLFAISPRDSKGFIQTYQRLSELGSLAPLPPRSVFPAILLSRSWSDLPVRFFIVSALLLSLALLVWVSLAVPQRAEVAFRLGPGGAGLEFQPSIRLMLLPVINNVFVLVDLLLGLFLYRRPDRRPFAFLLWGTGSLTPLLFLGAVYYLLRAS